MTTGQRIRIARKKANMTQAELASRLHIPYQSIGQWERDLRNPKYETLQALANELDVTVGYLQGYESLDAAKILDAINKSDFRTVESIMGLPEGSIHPLSNEESAEITKKIEKNAQNSKVNINKLKLYIKLCYGEFTEQDYLSLRAIIEKFSTLNDPGQKEAIRSVEIIAGNPDYQKEKKPPHPENQNLKNRK